MHHPTHFTLRIRRLRRYRPHIQRVNRPIQIHSCHLSNNQHHNQQIGTEQSQLRGRTRRRRHRPSPYNSGYRSPITFPNSNDDLLLNNRSNPPSKFLLLRNLFKSLSTHNRSGSPSFYHQSHARPDITNNRFYNNRLRRLLPNSRPRSSFATMTISTKTSIGRVD